MPSDIRSFFGGKPAGTPAKAPAKEEKPKRGRAKKTLIVEDSEDDDDP
jgi:replication factor C subunit 1